MIWGGHSMLSISLFWPSMVPNQRQLSIVVSDLESYLGTFSHLCLWVVIFCLVSYLTELFSFVLLLCSSVFDNKINHEHFSRCALVHSFRWQALQWDHAADIYRSGRRRVLSPRDERTSVRKVKINPRTTARDLVKMLEETGAKVSISTVKRVLYQLNLKGCSARKKTLLQNCHKKSDYGLQLHMGKKSYFLEKCPLVWWNKNRTVWP